MKTLGNIVFFFFGIFAMISCSSTSPDEDAEKIFYSFEYQLEEYLYRPDMCFA